MYCLFLRIDHSNYFFKIAAELLEKDHDCFIPFIIFVLQILWTFLTKLHTLNMKKILFVDDKPSISRLVVQFLKNSFDVTTREDGLHALSWLQDGNIPDLILTDLQMPNMDGFEFIKRIKESGYFSDIPVVVLSSRDSSSDRVKCLKMGAEDYLTKPFNPEELQVRIERILNREK